MPACSYSCSSLTARGKKKDEKVTTHLEKASVSETDPNVIGWMRRRRRLRRLVTMTCSPSWLCVGCAAGLSH